MCIIYLKNKHQLLETSSMTIIQFILQSLITTITQLWIDDHNFKTFWHVLVWFTI
jgi:hypothetical protein